MTLMKLLSFFFITTLTIHKSIVQGEMFISQGKGDELKVTEKRINNFRVPVDTSFDPNFWPARGRRSGEDTNKIRNENCVPDENSVYDKSGLRCQDVQDLNANSKDLQNLGNDFQEKPPGNCYYFPGRFEMSEECRRKLKPSISNLFDSNWLFQAGNDKNDRRHKKQKHFNTPIMLLYGDGVYWDLDNAYAEKEKKQDVFWVARGKKSIK